MILDHYTKYELIKLRQREIEQRAEMAHHLKTKPIDFKRLKRILARLQLHWLHSPQVREIRKSL